MELIMSDKQWDLASEESKNVDDHEEFRKSLADYQKENQKLLENNKVLRKNNERYLDTCVSKNETIDNLSRTVENLERECNRLKNELKEDSNDLNVLATKFVNQMEEICKLKKYKGRVAELELVVHELEKENNTLKLQAIPDKVKRDIARTSYTTAMWQTLIRAGAFVATVYFVAGIF